MDNRQFFAPNSVLAKYTPQRLPQFKGNPLIEALPPAMSNDELFSAMTLLPEFEPAQRQWSEPERMQMIATLSKFTIPLRRHVELARQIETLTRAGYCGRAPGTAEDAIRMQKAYAAKGSGIANSGVFSDDAAQLSSLLMGIPGMGKTTAVKRFFSNMPQVIYHPDLHLYQITYLHVEMPCDGASVKGMAFGILQQIDRLIPGANYYNLYAKTREGSDTLLRSVAYVMDQHRVGCLVADEVQNLLNSPKGKDKVMTELVSACNIFEVPILFIGTNKAARVFDLDFRKSRRGSGHGFEPWDRLSEFNEDQTPGEWRDFLELLWTFQWVQKPVALSADLATNMYHFSQGIIDIAIKLFASAQIKAIHNRSEQITTELLADVYSTQMTLLHPMMEALRTGDLNRLVQYPDLAPTNLEDVIAITKNKVRALASPQYTVKPGDEVFEASIAASLATAGIDVELATETAAEVVRIGTAKNLKEGVTQARKLLEPEARSKPKSKAKIGKAEAVEPEVTFEPDDYRVATGGREDASSEDAERVLRELGLLVPLEEILELA